MEKIIRAEDLMRAIRDDDRIDGRNFALVKEHIDEAVSVDAVEVVHGRWEDDYGDYVCSCCRTVFTDELVWLVALSTHKPNYCPNCGAKMDGAKHES